MSMTRLIIKGGTFLTMNAQMEVVRDGALVVEDGRISYIGPRVGLELPLTGADVIDGSGHIILPGLINTHTHLPMSLFRGLADDLPLKEWLEGHIFPAEAQFMDAEAARVGSRLAIAEMLLAGTTTCADGYFYENEVALAAREMGIRAVLGHGILDFPAPGVPDSKQNLSTVRHYIENFAGGAEQVPAVFAHSPYTCSSETLVQAKQMARELDLLFFIHAAETQWEVDWVRENHDGMTVIRYLDSLKLLDEKTVLVHAVHVDDEEIKMIAASGAAVSINTESGMKLASGIPPLLKYLDHNVTVSLGTDGCASNNDLDLFLEMSQTSRLHKLCSGDPAVLKARQLLQMATTGGAKALGMSHCIGSLEKGKAADVIAVTTACAHACPLYNPYSHLVYSASGADVSLVVVAGKILVKNAQLVTQDLNAILADANALSRKISPVW